MDKHGQIDMLHGPIWNKLPRFALPIAATAILEQLFNASDVAATALLMLATLLYYRPSRRFADTAHRRTKPCAAPDGEQKTSQTRRKTGASVTICSI